MKKIFNISMLLISFYTQSMIQNYQPGYGSPPNGVYGGTQQQGVFLQGAQPGQFQQNGTQQIVYIPQQSPQQSNFVQVQYVQPGQVGPQIQYISQQNEPQDSYGPENVDQRGKDRLVKLHQSFNRLYNALLQNKCEFILEIIQSISPSSFVHPNGIKAEQAIYQYSQETEAKTIQDIKTILQALCTSLGPIKAEQDSIISSVEQKSWELKYGNSTYSFKSNYKLPYDISNPILDLCSDFDFLLLPNSNLSITLRPEDRSTDSQRFQADILCEFLETPNEKDMALYNHYVSSLNTLYNNGDRAIIERVNCTVNNGKNLDESISTINTIINQLGEKSKDLVPLMSAITSNISIIKLYRIATTIRVRRNDVSLSAANNAFVVRTIFSNKLLPFKTLYNLVMTTKNHPSACISFQKISESSDPIN